MYLILPLIFTFASHAQPRNPIYLAVGENRVLSFKKIVRVGIGDKKIAKIKAIPPNQVLLTAKKIGRTTLQVWNDSNQPMSFKIIVDSQRAVREREYRNLHPMIRVSLQILEIHQSDGQSLGIQWPRNIKFSGRAGYYGGRGGLSGLNFGLGLRSASGWVNFIADTGLGRLIAEPELTVELGKPAIFHSGGEIAIRSHIRNGSDSMETVQWKPYGITLKVHPKSVDGFQIRSEIEASVVDIFVSGTGTLPKLHQKNIKTEINTEADSTTLLTSLNKQSTHKTDQAIPLLGDLPILGSPLLFGGRNTLKQSTELLIAITFSLAKKMGRHSIETKLNEEKSREHWN